MLKDGAWITPITGFPDWEGKMHGKLCGRALISKDEGKTWNDDSVCMEFENNDITCYEQRMCQLDSGAILLENKDVMMSHWFAENGEYKTAATRIKL